METQFLLSEQVYARAKVFYSNQMIKKMICICTDHSKVPPTDKVCLWLGANVMLEYTLDDAEVLLKKNCEQAEQNLAQIAWDLDYLRDQMTITEVTMARLYNWDVKRRKDQNVVAAN